MPERYDKMQKKGQFLTPNEFSKYLQGQATIMEQNGLTTDATALRKWISELRVKSLERSPAFEVSYSWD